MKLLSRIGWATLAALGAYLIYIWNEVRKEIEGYLRDNASV